MRAFWTASLISLWMLVQRMAFLLAGAAPQLSLLRPRMRDNPGPLITHEGPATAADIRLHHPMIGRRRPLVVVAVLAPLLGGSIACTGRAAPLAVPSAPSPLPTTQPMTRTPSSGGGFRLDVDQAAAVAVTVDFLNAYNAGDLDAALRSLGPDPGFSDCDYSAQQTADAHGRTQVASRLRQRFNDHSRIVWSDIGTDNPEDNALGVTVTRVKSDSLTKLGLPDGVAPAVGAKVVFTMDHRIARFALGPVGGSSTACRPRL